MPYPSIDDQDLAGRIGAISEQIGGMKPAEPVSDAAAAPTQADFNDLLAALRLAGILKTA